VSGRHQAEYVVKQILVWEGVKSHQGMNTVTCSLGKGSFGKKKTKTGKGISATNLSKCPQKGDRVRRTESTNALTGQEKEEVLFLGG